MSQAHELMAKVQADTIDAIKAQQEAMVAAAKQWGEAMSAMTPASMPGMPSAAPMVGNPTEMLDASFAFASELLSMNKKFAKDLLAASTPVAAPQDAPKKTK
ncbi:MAG: hypothetical protein V9F04_05880 [Dermatophilaceae bacterium]